MTVNPFICKSCANDVLYIVIICALRLHVDVVFDWYSVLFCTKMQVKFFKFHVLLLLLLSLDMSTVIL